MNFLLLEKEELNSDKSLGIIKKDRLCIISDRYVLEKGKELNIGIIGGRRGRGIIEKISSDGLYINTKLDKEPLEKKDLTLIVSVCRPQTNKKVLHIGVGLGLKKIIFLRGENVPKSYIQSNSLSKENIRKECLLAMAQTGDTIFPKIEIYNSIYECMKFEDFSSNALSNIVADTNCSEELNRKNFPNLLDVKVIAIGPESGWSEKEIEYFHSKNFKSVGLGKRILRVEIALSYLIGVVS
ncbi:MAG: RsmE family RNA methyltransferase [Bdellovibrionota bacterium]